MEVLAEAGVALLGLSLALGMGRLVLLAVLVATFRRGRL